MDNQGFFILKPCKTDSSYKVELHKRFPTAKLIEKLKMNLGAAIIAETPILTVLSIGSVRISVHINGELLLRNLHDEEDARILAQKIADAVAIHIS